MKAEIKKLYSLEIEDAMTEFRPSDPSNFGTWIRIAVGQFGEPGADNFELFVCTPLWLSAQLEHDPGIQWGRHLLIVTRYDFAAISDQIERLAARCTGEDWQTIATKFGRFAAWEFEDYKA